MDEECSTCDGTGKEFPDCEDCEGKGWVPDPVYGGTMTCPTCNSEDCSDCDGEGYITTA
jgi:DnaJ-class molecular chaperone